MWPWKRRKSHADPAKIAELERELGIGTERLLEVRSEGCRELVSAEQYIATPIKMEDVVVYTTVYGEQFVVTPENFLAVVANDGLRK